MHWKDPSKKRHAKTTQWADKYQKVSKKIPGKPEATPAAYEDTTTIGFGGSSGSAIVPRTKALPAGPSAAGSFKAAYDSRIHKGPQSPQRVRRTFRCCRCHKERHHSGTVVACYHCGHLRCGKCPYQAPTQEILGLNLDLLDLEGSKQDTEDNKQKRAENLFDDNMEDV